MAGFFRIYIAKYDVSQASLVKENWYIHQAAAVVENRKILIDFAEHAGHSIEARKHGHIDIDKMNSLYPIIDFTLPHVDIKEATKDAKIWLDSRRIYRI